MNSCRAVDSDVIWLLCETTYLLDVHSDHETPSCALITGMVVLILVSMVYDILTLFPEGVMLLAFALTALGVFSWYSSRLKFGSLDNDNLLVSGFLKGAGFFVKLRGRAAEAQR